MAFSSTVEQNENGELRRYPDNVDNLEKDIGLLREKVDGAIQLLNTMRGDLVSDARLAHRLTEKLQESLDIANRVTTREGDNTGITQFNLNDQISNILSTAQSYNPDSPETIILSDELLNSGFERLNFAHGVDIIKLRQQDLLERPEQLAYLLAAFGQAESRTFGEAWKDKYDITKIDDDSTNSKWYGSAEAISDWITSFLNLEGGTFGNMSILIIDRRVVGASAGISSASEVEAVEAMRNSLQLYLGLNDDAPQATHSKLNESIEEIIESFKTYCVEKNASFIDYIQLFLSSDRIIPILKSSDNITRLWEHFTTLDLIEKFPNDDDVSVFIRKLIDSLPKDYEKELNLNDKSIYLYRLFSMLITALPMVELKQRVRVESLLIEKKPPLKTILGCWTQAGLHKNKMAQIIERFLSLKVLTDKSHRGLRATVQAQIGLSMALKNLKPLPSWLKSTLKHFSKTVDVVEDIHVIDESDSIHFGNKASGKTQVLAAVMGVEELLEVIGDVKLITALLSINPKYWRIMQKTGVAEQ